MHTAVDTVSWERMVSVRNEKHGSPCDAFACLTCCVVTDCSVCLLSIVIPLYYSLTSRSTGKTTLLKAIAAMEIEGFPRHLRVLHVRQELKMTADDTPVLQAVLQSDVERNALLEEERSLLAELEQADETQVATTGGGSGTVQEKREKLHQQSHAKFQEQLKRLDEVYARLQVLAADAAESRAATILSGLQFTPEMQAGPTSALSGGWRMRVALAAALFIEPDLLMLGACVVCLCVFCVACGIPKCPLTHCVSLECYR